MKEEERHSCLQNMQQDFYEIRFVPMDEILNSLYFLMNDLEVILIKEELK